MEIHLYHLVVNSKLLDRVRKLAAANKMSISGYIVSILYKAGDVLGVMESRSNDRDSTYLREPDSVDCYVYMPIELYRKYKQIHANLNFYSMAQMVRFMIRFVLREERVYSKIDLKKRREERKNCIARNSVVNRTTFIKQLFYKPVEIIEFDAQSRPLIIRRI